MQTPTYSQNNINTKSNTQAAFSNTERDKKEHVDFKAADKLKVK